MIGYPFFKYTLSSWDEKKKQLLELFDEASLENPSHEESNVFTSYFNQSVNSAKLVSILSDSLEKFSEESGFAPAELQHAWFQKYTSNCFHTPHNHGMVGYSAICYIEFDKTCHTATQFILPWYNMFNGEQIDYSPDIKEGDIVIFPAQLMHFALPNKSDKPRIILSFNIRPS